MNETIYQHYFGLAEAPFSITPDPRFVYLSERHEDALAHLRYGIGQGGGGGFVQLTGEVGTGKTTLSRLLLEQLPEDARVALILNPRLEPVELLESICEELRVTTRGAKGSQKKLVDKLNAYLLDAHAKGLTVVLIIDEAQNLSPEALEQVRLLTNLETATQKLLQIIFLGQPELRDVLGRSDLRQLAQRITARYHLGPLDADETAAYVSHRLSVAGAPHNPFTGRALKTLYRLTDGIPRLINIIAERALLAAYATDSRRITPAQVRRAAAEVLGRRAPERLRPVLLGTGLMAAVAAVAVYRWPSEELPVLPTAEDPVAIAPVPTDVGDDPPPPLEPTPTPPAPPALTAEPFANAWQRLFQLRDRGAPATDGNRCALRLDAALFCLEGRGSLFSIRQLGRPVVVHLPRLPGGYAVLDAPGDELQLVTDAGRQPVDPMALEREWSGRFWDAWTMPGYVPTLLKEGDRGPGVLWVKSAAAQARPPYPMPVDDPYFGPSLKAWVEDFQSDTGLEADGLIGPETLQALSRFAREGSG